MKDDQVYTPAGLGVVTSKAGFRVHPVTGKGDFHNGVDLGANLNSAANSCTSLQAMEAATVNKFGPGVGVVTFLDTVANGAFSTTMNLACNTAINTISNGLWSGSADENFTMPASR